MESIITTLVEAGYFRARISSLSDFDKIIGGMAWAMQAFSYDLNINIFYTDSLDLGQKIALTERLVMVLLVLDCPHRIEPHQIVGLDYGNLLPAMRWLIKRSWELRREHEAFNRLLALRHFFRVTKSGADRASWCHVVPVAHLTRKSSARLGEAEELPLSSASSKTCELMEKIDADFKDNKRVSFVQLASLLRGVSQGQQESREQIQEEDSGESSGDEQQTSPKEQAKRQVAPAEGPIGDRSITEEVDGESEELLALHRELDCELLATNQKIVNLLRKLDSMPSALEIIQYQRRYIELHQQLISKNRDVKKLFALFNSLEWSKHYLTREINLIESISSNLELTNNSSANRDQFLEQLESIIGKIRAVRDEVVTRLDVIKSKCEALSAEYASILDD